MLRQKCENPRSAQYKAYGAKGVAVCDSWKGENGFENFLKEVGSQPFAGAGLRRLDEAGHFEPGNVTWVNTRPCRVLTHAGRSMSITAWASELGVKPGTLRARLHAGWSVPRVLTKKVSQRRPHSTWKRRVASRPSVSPELLNEPSIEFQVTSQHPELAPKP
jgi:hypothetical protein